MMSGWRDTVQVVLVSFPAALPTGRTWTSPRASSYKGRRVPVQSSLIRIQTCEWLLLTASEQPTSTLIEKDSALTYDCHAFKCFFSSAIIVIWSHGSDYDYCMFILNLLYFFCFSFLWYNSNYPVEWTRVTMMLVLGTGGSNIVSWYIFLKKMLKPLNQCVLND